MAAAVLTLALAAGCGLAEADDSSCQPTQPWQEWSVWAVECVPRVLLLFKAQALGLSGHNGSQVSLSTRTRACRCPDADAGDCPGVLVSLRWRPLSRRARAACGWCSWGTWGQCGCGSGHQWRRRRCFCFRLPGNASSDIDDAGQFVEEAGASCSGGWSLASGRQARECDSQPDCPPAPPQPAGGHGSWLAGVSRSVPNVFKAIFIVVALVVAVITLSGVCIAVQSRLSGSGSNDSIFRTQPPLPPTPAADEESQPLAVADAVEESKRLSVYPDPITPTHPLSYYESDDDDDDDDGNENDVEKGEEKQQQQQQQQQQQEQQQQQQQQEQEPEQDEQQSNNSSPAGRSGTIVSPVTVCRQPADC